MSTSNAARRRAQLQRARNRRKGGGGENAAMLRLMICGILFVLLVAAKLLFPEAVGRLASSARQLIGQDADFQEAFAAMGRAVSGEQAVSDSLQDAYTAVFNPTPQPADEPDQEPPEISPATSPADEETEGVSSAPADVGAQLLRQPPLKLPEADQAMMREVLISPEDTAVPVSQPASDNTQNNEEPSDDTAVAEASWAYSMAAMPENASLEQRNLGFPHCTPVAGHLTSTFGWREHPVEGGNKFHYGVDLGAETGTDILAFADGEFYASGESSTLGNYVMLRHPDGYVTLYAHCSRVTVSGGSVKMGEKIAEVGDTGLTTGPHLHFELHDGELYLNPIYYVDIG